MPKTTKKKNQSTTRPHVPYVRGFHPPTAEKCLEAIGSTRLDKAYTPSDSSSRPCPTRPLLMTGWRSTRNRDRPTNCFLKSAPGCLGGRENIQKPRSIRLGIPSKRSTQTPRFTFFRWVNSTVSLPLASPTWQNMPTASSACLSRFSLL